MIPDKIKFGCLVEKGVAEVKEMPMPELLADEILVKQDACNICTTDYQQWLGLREHQGYPMAGGHECSGTIVAKGSAVGDTYDVGDRVSVVYDYCGYCDECKHGEVTGCENIKMNPDLSPSEAAFVEPLSSVIRNMKKLRVKSGTDTVVVIGGGTMGLLNAETARAFGARVIVSELMEKKVEIAKSMGFEVINPKEVDPVQKVKELTNGKGADIVIVAVGATPANNQALQMVKPKDGKISMYAAGYPAPEMDVDPNKVHYMRLELIGTYGSTLEDFSDAAEMLNTGRVNVSKLVETQIPLDEIQKAFETASTPGNYRVSVILN